jgi:hypothetical protein
MTSARILAWSACLALAAANAAAQSPAPAWRPLFDGKSLQGWKETPFSSRGSIQVKDGVIELGAGRTTGITWTGDFPKSNYEIRFEAVRRQGHDFFAGLTFPVKNSFCTWINGGWGGTVVGLSNLDGDDASENDTSTMKEFETGRWYAFRLAVSDTRIQAWIDGALIIDADISGGRRVDLRFGEDDLSTPLGFSSYATAAGLRNIHYRRLTN